VYWFQLCFQSFIWLSSDVWTFETCSEFSGWILESDGGKGRPQAIRRGKGVASGYGTSLSTCGRKNCEAPPTSRYFPKFYRFFVCPVVDRVAGIARRTQYGAEKGSRGARQKITDRTFGALIVLSASHSPHGDAALKIPQFAEIGTTRHPLTIFTKKFCVTGFLNLFEATFSQRGFIY